MSGLHTSKEEVSKRLGFYRGFALHGTKRELASMAYDAISNTIAAAIRSGEFGHLKSELDSMMTKAKQAKLAADLEGLEEVKENLKTLLKNDGVFF